MLDKYKNKTALITGASSGIGKEFAIQLHKLGMNLILVARRESLLKELAEQLNLLRTNSVIYKACDLTKDLTPINMYADQVDLLINNAGIGSFGYFEDLEDLNLVETNISSTLKTLKLFIPSMKRNKFGGIISVSSIAAFQPLPLMATYAATKAFNYMHTMALRAELQEFGIQTLVVCPGPTATEFGGVARVPGTMTGVVRDSVYEVVYESLRAFEKGKPVVITGFRSKITTFLCKYLPVTLTTLIVKKQLFKAYNLSQK